ncbi:MULTISPECIES: HXXEE domain-containing protein [unclassified Bradyrhizobium]|uniref:HXXEE domain-containing protein n=1 Tax=unclassified Bradyrhizobium TaxID=2631580 RepID=UPI0028EAF87E|nr:MULTISPECIES: HXXEE domain-containing protein [unclassified Bradyrhizobium]
MLDLLSRHWVAGAVFMAAALLALVPLLAADWPLALLLIFLHSPGYMIHQVEEHTGDRFRSFVNNVMFGGREALTTIDVLWVNCGAVWGIDLIALYVAWIAGPAWALVAPYLMLVNSLGHIGPALRFRGYNPGLVTGIVLFIPLGLVTVLTIPATAAQHALGFGLSLLLHVIIAANAIRRASHVRAAA